MAAVGCFVQGCGFLDSFSIRLEVPLMHFDRRVRKLGQIALCVCSICIAISSALDLQAAILAARVAVTGTTDATTSATVSYQTPGPALAVANSPAELGDLSLTVGGSPLAQSNGVVIAAPNQFQFAAVGDRNMIEIPGELSSTLHAGFPNGMWLSTTRVAGAGGAEANFNVALAHFPFADGWIAGHIKGSDGTFLAGNSAGVTVTTQFGTPDATFGNGHYKLSIAGVDSRAHGMLYAVSEEDSNSGNVVPVGVLPDGSGWDVRVNDQNGNFPATEQADWSFVYIPYNAANMIAAGNLRRTGSTLDVLTALGTFSASAVDLGPNAGGISPPGTPDGTNDLGRFLITIPGKDDTTGYLLVGVSAYASAGGFSGADDNFLAWEYMPSLGGFLVDSMDLTGATLQNSDIYFAYFDYANPILPTPEPGAASLALMGAVAFSIGRRKRHSPV
jgi:hypothetical protein